MVYGHGHSPGKETLEFRADLLQGWRRPQGVVDAITGQGLLARVVSLRLELSTPSLANGFSLEFEASEATRLRIRG